MFFKDNISNQESIAGISILFRISLYSDFFIDEGKIYSEDEADERYSLGLIAIRNFDGYEGFA